MHKLAVAFITFVIVIVAEVKCENLHLFGIVGPDAFRPGDAEMHRSYSLHNLNMMASLNHMKDRIAQKEPYFKRFNEGYINKRYNKRVVLPVLLLDYEGEG